MLAKFILECFTREKGPDNPTLFRVKGDKATLRHYIEIAYGILLRGATFANVWDSVLAMVAIGISLFALGLGRFRAQFG